MIGPSSWIACWAWRAEPGDQAERERAMTFIDFRIAMSYIICSYLCTLDKGYSPKLTVKMAK